MFSKTWKTSEPRYKVVIERDVKIGMSDGIDLNADLFRPESDGQFPAIFGFHPYNQTAQTAPMMTRSFSTNFFRLPGQEEGNAYIEAGDPYAYVPRGYVYVIANVRGTGKSGGKYPFLAPRELQDGAEAIEWIARQPWCSGKVGMFGVSYFAWIQLFIAALNPPALKCIFAPWAATDLYRDSVYHGGILGHGFWRMWASGSIHNGRVEPSSAGKEEMDRLLEDEDIAGVPELVQILKNPDKGTNPILVDLLLHAYDGPYWEQRKVNYPSIKVP
ncbi:MAG: CocE/NonD family hydrolase, partial [Desulfobacterales bacterium]|nr:CocE/NonD family hydrolase [Desulfobacterales bacterium]